MTHKLWCGQECCDCTERCRLDSEIPCSPDCEYLSADGDKCFQPGGSCDFFKEQEAE